MQARRVGLLTTADCLRVKSLGIVLVEDVGGNVGGLVEDHLLGGGEEASRDGWGMER